MKEAISGTFLFNIVIAFILLFTGLMTLTINRSRAILVKDEVVNIIEKYNGIDTDLDLDTNRNTPGREMQEVMQEASYRSTGTCSGDGIGFNRDGDRESENPSVCIEKISTTEANDYGDDANYLPGDTTKGCYYRVELFYVLDIPILNEFFTFSVIGESKVINGSCD